VRLVRRASKAIARIKQQREHVQHYPTLICMSCVSLPSISS
jgi:hypothetical protein